MALRGGKPEVIKVLIEFGAVIPPGTQTGLTDQELMLARWKAREFGNASEQEGSQAAPDDFGEIEEIKIVTCYGTSTDVLNADMRRALDEIDNAKPNKN